jgi:hypothetical protein
MEIWGDQEQNENENLPEQVQIETFKLTVFMVMIWKKT